MAHHQRHQVNQTDNDSSEHTDNENDRLVRPRDEITFDDFIDSINNNFEDNDDYAASPVPQSTDDNNLDVWQTSGDEEIRNANLEPLRRTRAELYDDSDDETQTESEEPDLPGIQRRRLLEDELETEAESSETDSLAHQDPDALEILNKLSPTAKKNQKDNRKTEIRLITSRMNQKAKHYDPLIPEFDEDHIKALRARSRLNLSPLKNAMPPKIVESEKTPQYVSLIRNLVAAQSTNVLAAESIFQKGKLEVAERILVTFELIGQATGEAQQLRKQHLDHRSSRFSYNKHLISATFSSKEKKAMKEERQISSNHSYNKNRSFQRSYSNSKSSSSRERSPRRGKRGRRSYFNYK
ncbi:MAG: hypothetical protein EZS28_020990 [Streblomastix strix]|uniref:Uncharacterized protein n=1 Tax=Streblomastix strix TaxID=222440 RepID=A0A5J4VMI1_9EUKA|nr:MAG: hypothetical protein EZS28_020990 [Streblomastix strix]